LREQHCDRAQGSFFSRAIPKAKLLALLRRDRKLALRGRALAS
jgi:EAL domain-containing protein (putative c-di-GMP-specific phosphodiesterase class I)